MKNLKALAFITSAVIVVTAVFLFCRENNTQKREDEIFRKQEQLFSEISPDVPNQKNDEKTDYLSAAKKINPQVAAWINIPDTEIDFPIVQCENNSYYLNHDFENRENYMGVPFLDYRNQNDFSDFNSIVYGHNIKGKHMFSQLTDFKDERFFREHLSGILTTSGHVYNIEFIACAVVENDSFAYETVFLTQKEKLFFLNSLKEYAVQMTDFSDEEISEKSLITLSTCSYEYENARTILTGYLYE